MSAIVVPLLPDGNIDWHAFEAHVARTHEAGLTPAVNMDTGYVQILDTPDKLRALDIAAAVTDGAFVAGAFVADQPGAEFDLAAYCERCAEITQRGATPVIFPSHGLNTGTEASWVSALQAIGSNVDQFIGFELGTMFVPYGRIASLEAYRAMMEIRSCIGAKHSSLNRRLEWDRIAARDEQRPAFKVFTGNDLAIDMVMYGSDYLLGLSTFAPDAFALRDRLWASGSGDFYELNDVLQYLGAFAFRAPVPAYRHDAAMFLELRGWAQSSAVPEGVPQRPASDRAVLALIAEQLQQWL
jgi:dihydrodipicolinate synthase/N-acetylneuraminate lyase